MKVRYTLAVRIRGMITVDIDADTDRPDSAAIVRGSDVASELVHLALVNGRRPAGVLDLHVDGTPWICATADVE